MAYLQRNLLPHLIETLSWSPAVAVHGPRQTGKTVLVRDQLGESRAAEYITFDDLLVRALAQRDPQGFILGQAGPVTIDEVQRVPEVLLPIKLSVDRDRTPGRFVLTGSTDLRAMKQVVDALPGRLVTSTLWPLSQGEIEGRVEQFLDWAFSGSAHLPGSYGLSREELISRVLQGGYPDLRTLELDTARIEWARSHTGAIVQRDVPELANIADVASMYSLVVMLAAETATIANMNRLSRDTEINRTTIDRYIATLERLYVVTRVQPWSKSTSKRLTRAAKLLFVDTGLAAALQGLNSAALERNPTRMGRLLDSFVGMELMKQMGWSQGAYSLMHYRDHAGPEVDWVVERADGQLVAIEVKYGVTPGRDDLVGLRSFANAVGDRFERGILLYSGGTVVPMGDNIIALPVAALWRM